MTNTERARERLEWALCTLEDDRWCECHCSDTETCDGCKAVDAVKAAVTLLTDIRTSRQSRPQVGKSGHLGA